MAYKFEQLEVWQRALEYTDRTYQIADQLPKHERYNLADQLTRAANSIALNIAEGSTGVIVALRDYPQDAESHPPLTKEFVNVYDAFYSAMVFIFGSIQK